MGLADAGILTQAKKAQGETNKRFESLEQAVRQMIAEQTKTNALLAQILSRS